MSDRVTAALWGLCIMGCIATFAVPYTTFENAVQIVICTGLTVVATRGLKRSEARSDEMIDAAVEASLRIAEALARCAGSPTGEAPTTAMLKDSIAQVVVMPGQRGRHSRI